MFTATLRVLLIAISLGISQSSANSWSVASPPALDPISNHTITSIHAGSPSRVWIASTDEVFAFDGWKLVKVPVRWGVAHEIPSKRVLDIFESPGNQTFMVTDSEGIFYRDVSQNEFLELPLNHTKQSRFVRAVSISLENSTAVLLHEKGLSAFDLNSQRLSVLAIPEHAGGEPPIGLLPSRGQYVDVVYRDKIVTLVWQVDRFVPFSTRECDVSIVDIKSSYRVAERKYYVVDSFGAIRGLKLTDNGCDESGAPPWVYNQIGGSRVNAVFGAESSDAVSIATNRGLLVGSKDNHQWITAQDSSLLSNEVTSGVKITDGNILMGTFRGVFQASYGQVTTITRLHNENSPSVSAIDSNDSLGVFVASSHAVYRHSSRNGRFKFTPIPVLKSHSGYSSLHVTKEGIWLGLHGGEVVFCRLQSRAENCDMSRIKSLSRSPVTDIIAVNQDAREVFVATLGGEVFRVWFDGIKLGALNIRSAGQKSPRLFGLLPLSAGKALFFYDDGAWISVVRDSAFSNQEAGDLSIPRSFVGSFWAAASNEHFTALSSSRGQIVLTKNVVDVNATYEPARTTNIGETVYAVELDELGRVWAGTKSGLWVSRPDDPPIKVVPTSGPDSISIDYGASHRDSRGNLYFGGTGGLLVIENPEKLPRETRDVIRISQIRIPNFDFEFQNLLPRAPIQIAGAASFLEFTLTTESVPAPPPPEFQYKLQGFDDRWQSAGSSNVATYTNIPPGRYTFRARGANSTGNWSENEVALKIHVLPPFWRSWWAIACYVLLLTCLIMFVKRLNDRNVLRRERLRLAEAGAAAFSRLEDDYQEEREANERLLESRKTAALSLLDVVETTFSVQDSEIDDPDRRSTAILEKLTTLKNLQELTTRATSSEKSDLHALTNEICAEMAVSHELAARAIISNAVTVDLVPLEHAIYLCLVIHEALYLALLGRDHNGAEEPMVLIDLSALALLESGEYQYSLHVNDSALPATEQFHSESYLPLTLHLIETRGGDIRDVYEAGNNLHLRLQFSAPSTALD